MLFSKEYVGYLARQVVKRLQDNHFIQTHELEKVIESVQSSMVEELSLEDRINDEVRVILEAYSDEMRNRGANYQEMFKRVKNELVKIQGGAMRLSREKLNKLASASTEQLAGLKEVEFPGRLRRYPPGTAAHSGRTAGQRGKARQSGTPQDRKPESHHSRRQPGVEYPLPQVLQR